MNENYYCNNCGGFTAATPNGCQHCGSPDLHRVPMHTEPTQTPTPQRG